MVIQVKYERIEVGKGASTKVAQLGDIEFRGRSSNLIGKCKVFQVPDALNGQ